jgi:Uncharacterised protein family (UPF0193)
MAENAENIDDYEFTNAKELLKISREMKTDDLWKLYGKETEAGKLLYKIYGKGANTVKINYPKPKPRPKSQAETEDKERKIPVSKTVIEYPSVKKTQNLPKIHMVDLIPKRKPEVEIRKEIEDYYSKPMMIVKPGGNRKEKIRDLQDKFKKGRGALPKDIELPVPGRVDYDDDEPTDEEIRERALMKVPQKNLMLTTKPNHNKENEEKNKKPMNKNEEDVELENLYQQVEQEIEDRQKYLEEINHLDEPKIKERIKKEIVERVSELEKIIKLMHK